jgi:hypothetical protein
VLNNRVLASLLEASESSIKGAGKAVTLRKALQHKNQRIEGANSRKSSSLDLLVCQQWDVHRCLCLFQYLLHKISPSCRLPMALAKQQLNQVDDDVVSVTLEHQKEQQHVTNKNSTPFSPVKARDANLLLQISSGACQDEETVHEETQIDIHRNECLNRKRKIQDDQAIKMTKMRQASVNEVGAKRGDIVCLKINTRDATQANGIRCIVFCASDSGGVRVVCEHGVITRGLIARGRPPGVLYLSIEMYKKLNPNISLNGKLQKLRNSVLDGTFNADQCCALTMTMAHKKIWGRSTVGKRKCQCRGCCGPQCGCKRKKVPCSSGCGCSSCCSNRNV